MLIIYHLPIYFVEFLKGKLFLKLIANCSSRSFLGSEIVTLYGDRQAECGRLAGAVESTWPEHVAKIYRKWNQDRDLELQR
jgi:hypothetical protein